MSERLTDTLSPLTPEDFDYMMGDVDASQRSIVLPYGMDVMITPPEGHTVQALHCGVDTGDGDGSEDEYPPVHDPNSGSVEALY